MLTSCCLGEECEHHKTEWERTGKRWYSLDFDTPQKEDEDSVYEKNIVCISEEGWSMFQLFWFSLEAYWV